MIFSCTMSERMNTSSPSTCTLPGASRTSSSNKPGSNSSRSSRRLPEVHDIVQHAAGPVDIVHDPVFLNDGIHSRKRAPFIGGGGPVADHLQMIGAGIEGKAQRDSSPRLPGDRLNFCPLQRTFSMISLRMATLPTWL